MNMQNRTMTEGSLVKGLILFALPMIAGNLLQQVYNLADTLIVGRLIGSEALAAVGSAYTLMVFLTSVIIGLCMGSGAFFSQDYGEGNNQALKRDILHSFVMIAAVTIIIVMIIYPCMDGILLVLQTPTQLITTMKEYVSVIFAGMGFVFLYNFFSFLFRSLGNSMVPLIYLAVSSITNIILDIWFVAGWHMGVAGAAWATVIAQGLSAIGIVIHAYRKLDILHFTRQDLKFDTFRMKQIIVNDVSTAIQQSVMNFGILMIQGLVNSFGTIIMASFAAAVKIDTIAYMPAQEFGNAYSLFISQNYGAGKKDRIRKGTTTAFALSSLFCCIISVFIFLFAENLMGIFVSSSEVQIITEGAKYLRIEGAMYVGIGILFLWYGYFRAINRPQISLLLTIISLGTRVALSYALAPHTPLGVLAIWTSIPIGWVLADISGYLLYRKHAL